MFGETRLATPYFQQITPRSKIINIQLQNNSHSTPFFEQTGVTNIVLPNIEGCQFNLP